VVELPSDRPNNLGLKPGEAIALLAPNESFCTLFGLSKIGKTQILFNAQRITASSLPPAIQAELIIPWEDYDIYRVTRVDM
jgi:acyl-CoA synthetase (AMP-forming)/AMP-acid ligase II